MCIILSYIKINWNSFKQTDDVYENENMLDAQIDNIKDEDFIFDSDECVDKSN